VVRRALDRPRSADTLPETVPAALCRLIDGLLDPDPAHRPGGARDIAARLAAIEGSGAEAELEPSPMERALAVHALPFAGSEDTLARLVAALAKGGVIAVSGPSGSGRSRLVTEAVRRHQRARAMAGTGVPTRLRVESRLPDEPLRHDTILHVESADEVTGEAARALVRAARIAGIDAAVVLERTVPVEADAAVELGPVSDASLASLVAAAFGGEPDRELVHACREASGGLPGRLCRLLATGWAGGLDPSRPETVRDLGSQYVASATTPHIPEDARAVAELAALLGGELDRPALVARTTSRARSASYGFELLVAAGLASLTESGRLHLRADVTRALRRDVPAARRERLLEAVDRDALDRVARAYYALARGEPEAVDALLAAIAERRQAGDPEGAARLAEDGQSAFETPDARLSVAHADALRARGRYADAFAALEGARTEAAVLLRAEVARLRGQADRAAACVASLEPTTDAARLAVTAFKARLAFDRGALEEAESLAASVLTSNEPADGGADSLARMELARALEVRALVHLARGRTDDAMRAAGEVVARARLRGDRATEARARSLAATAALTLGRMQAGARGYADAFELAEQAGELHAAATYLVNLGIARLDGGALGPALSTLREGARRLARLERDRDLARALYNLANAAALVGDDDVARAAVARAAEAATRCGDVTAAGWAQVVLAEIELRAGAIDRAREAMRSACSTVEGAPGVVRAPVAARAAIAHLAASDLASAEACVAAAARAADEAETSGARFEHEVAAARYALRAGDVDAARHFAARAQASAEKAGTFEARLRAALLLGDTSEASRHDAIASRAFADARALLDEASQTLDRSARARLRAVPSYQRALATTPAEPDPRDRQTGGWRRLVARAKRLTAERRTGRLYEEILDAAIDLAGAQRGFLVMRRPDGTLGVRIRRGIDADEARDASGLEGEMLTDPDRLMSRSIVARAIDGGTAVSSMDAVNDGQLAGAASVHSLSLRSVVAVPLRSRGTVIGALYLDDRLRPGAFGETQLALLEDLADIATIALDGAERLRTERRTKRRLAQLQRKLEAQVETQAVEIDSLRRHQRETVVEGIVAESEAMGHLLDLALRFARADVPALISGESGTGKELVARAIHAHSRRAEGPFVIENCGAVPESLLESALFGHVRGAFTGAERARQGLFAVADGGTLVLDEIGEMSPAMQAKLLRAAQEGEIRPVGSERTQKVDVRLVAATHRDLEAMVERGEFREDLYYRLAVVGLRVPPLRERVQDIPPLVAHFVEKHAPDRTVRISPRALSALQSRSWPGNVRQLENEIQRALVLCDEVLGEEHLSDTVATDEPPAPAPSDLKGQVERLERKLIAAALAEEGGNQTRAAKRLGVSRYGLQKMIKRLGIG
jgi:transcriptional regulator with GAF, ATPase, and Fis domain